MADVYLARRRAAGVEKWLVVKRMRPETSGDPRFLDLFVREARLSMSLAHQNIVPVFDFGKIDDQVFLAMERVEGKDLGSSLARSPSHSLPPLLAAFIAAECCQALDYAHQRKSPEGVALGIVHRDVTPRNVLLSWSGEVKLTDFGIAALAGDATSRLLGTPQYMAPEQARSEPIDPRADIYALGLVLREAVVGSRPRPGADRETILDAARRGELLPWVEPVGVDANGDAAPAVDPRTSLPPALVAIIDRATAATPDERYADARSMLEELDSFIVGERAAHKAESPARQLAGWLAQVWDGARDDIEPSAAIDAGHLVSFLDDGALDVLGTGTVRSMASTAAEEASAPALGTPPVGAGSPLRPPSGPLALVPASADSVNRRKRMSSSQASVASGSFHTIPERPDSSERTGRTERTEKMERIQRAERGERAERPSSATRVTRPSGSSPIRRRPRQIIPLVIVAVVVGATVFVLTNSYRDRDRRDLTRQATAESGRQEGAGRDERPVFGQPGPGATSDRSRPSAPGPTTAAPPPSSNPAKVSPARPGVPRPAPAQLGGNRPPPGRVDPGAAGATDAGSGSGVDDAGVVDASKPATCRVRINITPWAYYTADGDTTRHETPGTIDLTPGPHRLRVWNPELGISRDITIHVPADRDTMNYSEPLQLPPLPADAGSD